MRGNSRIKQLLFVSLISILTAVILAACGGGEPTNTPAPTTEAVSTDENAPQFTVEFTPGDPALEIATLAAENNIVVQQAAPGTLIFQQAVGEGTQPAPEVPFSFNLIMVQRYGGLSDENFIIRLTSDGELDRNGEIFQVTPEQVERIRVLFDEMNFYSASGIFTDASATDETIYYTVGVDGERGTVSITAQEGLVPPQLLNIINTIFEFGISQ